MAKPIKKLDRDKNFDTDKWGGRMTAAGTMLVAIGAAIIAWGKPKG